MIEKGYSVQAILSEDLGDDKIYHVIYNIPKTRENELMEFKHPLDLIKSFCSELYFDVDDKLNYDFLDSMLNALNICFIKDESQFMTKEVDLRYDMTSYEFASYNHENKEGLDILGQLIKYRKMMETYTYNSFRDRYARVKRKSVRFED